MYSNLDDFYRLHDKYIHTLSKEDIEKQVIRVRPTSNGDFSYTGEVFVVKSVTFGTKQCDNPFCRKLATKKCSKCLNVSYCSEECQVGRSEVRKNTCKLPCQEEKDCTSSICVEIEAIAKNIYSHPYVIEGDKPEKSNYLTNWILVEHIKNIELFLSLFEESRQIHIDRRNQIMPFISLSPVGGIGISFK